MRYFHIVAAAAVVCAPLATAHSYIQQLRLVDDSGKYVGDAGYSRGFCAKGDPACTADDEMNYLTPDPDLFISDKNLACHPKQRKPEQKQPEQYPRLKAVPGMYMALRYTENGHVTLKNTPGDDTNIWKEAKGGTIFIYGTTDPKEDEKLVDVLRWTKDGKGGDGRGVLLGTNDFDDGRCYEINDLPKSFERSGKTPSYAMGQTGQGEGRFGVPCESNVALPKTAATGKPYTLYWVWQWNTRANFDPARPLGQDQYYTTCIDVDVVDTFSSEATTMLKYATPQQDDISVAVSDFASRTALQPDVVKGEIGPYFKDHPDKPSAPPAPSASGAPPAPPASGAPSTSATPSTPSAPQTTLATSVLPPFGNGTGPTGIPNMTARPGRPQPSSSPADDNGNGGDDNSGTGGDDVVTVTDIVYITVTAPSTPQVTSRATGGKRRANDLRRR